MISDRPVLITGASGFLGEHLAHWLTARSVAVVGTYWQHAVDVPRASLAAVDLRDGGAVRRLVRDLAPSAIVHCAAITDAAACERNPDAARSAILTATEELAAAVAEFGPDTPVLGVSTDLVFDGEQAPYSPADCPKPLSVYGSLKYASESPILALRHGAVVRSALMYGRPSTHQGSFLAWMVASLAAGQRLELFEDEVRTPVHVEDLCRALATLIELKATGVWHAGGPERLTRMEMGRQVCRALGFDEELLVGRKLADSSYAAPRPRDVSLLSEITWRQTGFQPRRFAEGLKKCIE